jgi:hypothetical protein
MTEKEARKQLRKMLGSLTCGSILHLLGDLHRERAAKENDAQAAEQLRNVEIALLVVGLGVDAACPR